MRSYLKEGTLIRVSGGVIYKITGEPIGEGGGSVTYPALRMLPSGDGYRTGQINYAVKECYPESDKYTFVRNAFGEICVSADVSSTPAPIVTSMSEQNVSSTPVPTEAAAPNLNTPEKHLSDARSYLERTKRMQSREETVTGQIYNHAFRLTPVLESYSHVEIAPDEGGEFRPAANMISIMESLSGKGRSLKNYLKERKSLKAGEAFEVIRQVLLAVGEVHRSGFLHLDIQDGNIFIKGVLDKNDCMLSLIDFGAARPLLEDGLCAEITDRVLFSTRGFTAPEILLKNDGHLRLGKQADIYSIGCLLLVLLTGHRYATAELTANKTGRFIPRFAVRKTGCPSHLIEKMQGIIAKALETDETTRYPSTEDMLADVDELLALLAPHRDPLSAAEFDAFICYAHGEKDSAAAMALRNALERYKSGFRQEKKIKRVFLDEGELSSCSDFGERINTALRNSKWLIVLCSEHTRESKWVNEEIKSFLRYHDKSRILAVVIEGEPGEVYPEELAKNGLTAENLFAADARAEDTKGIVRKIKGDVRLQIAAPILDTTFDALKQRRRLYAVQRAFAGTAIVLCALAGFFAYAALKAGQIAEQEKQIAKQAETIVREQNDKLESQADLLAEQAQAAYDGNDYSNAARLALSSLELSQANPERQSNLKRLLILCLNLYNKWTEASLLVSPTGMISDGTGTEISGYYLNSDGSRLFSVSENRFCVWDTSDCSMISSCEAENILPRYNYNRDEMNLIEEKGRCILWTEEEIWCWDYESGKTVWTIGPGSSDSPDNSDCPDNSDSSDSPDNPDSSDSPDSLDNPDSSDSSDSPDSSLRIRYVLLSQDHERIYRITAANVSGQVQEAVHEIDSATGEILGEHIFADDIFRYNTSSFCLSPDNKCIALIHEYTKSADAGDTTAGDMDTEDTEAEDTDAGDTTSSMEEMLCVLNLDDDTMTKIDVGETDPWGTYLAKDVSFIDGTRILISKYEGPVAVRTALDDARHSYYIKPKHITIDCYNCQTGDSIWHYDTVDGTEESKGTNPADFRSLQVPRICRTEIDQANVIAAAFGSTFLMLNEETGECIANLMLDSAILSLEELNKHFQLVLENGCLGIIPKTSAVEQIITIEGFPAGVSVAVSKEKRFYIVNRSDYSVITEYERGKQDDGYTETVMKDQTAFEYIDSLPGDDRITEKEGISLKLNGDSGFEIIGDKSYKVKSDDTIEILSFTPEGDRIFAGFRDKVRLYDPEGRLVTEADLPQGFSFYGAKAHLFYPEPGTCLYTDGAAGFLMDINESGIVFLKYITDAAGFDHETNELIICNKYQDEGDGVTVGRFRYYTDEEIREKAAEFSGFTP